MDNRGVALRQLGRYRGLLTRQQIKTLRGKILEGDTEGAMNGLQTILRKNQIKRKE